MFHVYPSFVVFTARECVTSVFTTTIHEQNGKCQLNHALNVFLYESSQHALAINLLSHAPGRANKYAAITKTGEQALELAL